MDEEKKRKTEERKQRILSKGASRLALVKGETSSLEPEPPTTATATTATTAKIEGTDTTTETATAATTIETIPPSSRIERPLAARRAKEIAVINENLLKSEESTSEEMANELIEKLKESTRRRKEIEKKVIECTDEFDRQQTAPTTADGSIMTNSEISSTPQSDENSTSNVTATTTTATTTSSSTTAVEKTPQTKHHEIDTSSSTTLLQSQLKDLITFFFLVIFATLCGLFHARESQYCAISQTGIDVNYASPEDAREQLLAYAERHYQTEMETQASSCSQPSYFVVFLTHPFLSIIMAWSISSYLTPVMSLILPVKNQMKSTSITSLIISLLLSGYEGILDIFLEILGQISLHILITLVVSSFLHFNHQQPVREEL